MALSINARRRARPSFRTALAAPLGLAAALVALSTPHSSAETAGPVVVELFTSQGCSMCPPADALLGELSQREDVIALTFNVTYWDYLGWRDAFGRDEHGERQHGYANAHRTRPVYTPQIIVQGGWSVIGNRRSEVEEAIATAHAQARAAQVALRREGDTLVVDITPTGAGMGDAEACRVVLVGFDGPHETHIGRGENSGHTITYHNVVREMRDVGDWRGAARTITLDINPEMSGYAVLLQGEEHGPVFAAGAIEF